MFTGIVESIGTVVRVEQEGSNRHFWVRSELTPELKIDQSISHDGVCLTVVEFKDNTYRVTAIEETLGRTTLGDWRKDHSVNLERCMPAGGRFDGHVVQGHVDTTAVVKHIDNRAGSWNIDFELTAPHKGLIVPKGSITVNGVSLTVVECAAQSFRVSIIPYTFEHTSFAQLQQGSSANIEFDILGKYVQAAIKEQLPLEK